MIIRLNTLNPGLQVIECSYDINSLDAGKEGIKYTTPLYLKGELDKGDGNIAVNAKLIVSYEGLCARCLNEMEGTIEKDLKIYKKIGQENEIDITEDVREDLILALPVKILCNDECKGLCPECGQDLNEQDCDCK